MQVGLNTYIHEYIYIQMHTYSLMHVCLHPYHIYRYLYTNMHTHTYIHAYLYTDAVMSAYIFKYIPTWMHSCISEYIHACIYI